MVICDNLDSHIFGGFLEGLKSLGAERNLLIAGETEMLQAIDGGIGSILNIDATSNWAGAKLTQHYLMQHASTHIHNDMAEFICLLLPHSRFKILAVAWLNDSANFDAWEVALFSYFNCYLYEDVYIYEDVYGRLLYFHIFIVFPCNKQGSFQCNLSN